MEDSSNFLSYVAKEGAEEINKRVEITESPLVLNIPLLSGIGIINVNISREILDNIFDVQRILSNVNENGDCKSITLNDVLICENEGNISIEINSSSVVFISDLDRSNVISLKLFDSGVESEPALIINDLMNFTDPFVPKKEFATAAR